MKNSVKTSIFRISILLAIFFPVSGLLGADWIHLPPREGTANGKKIVFVTGDDEYKSETSMPMMAHILAERHGFDCTVLFAINRKTGVIDTNQRDHIPGLEALADADLMVIYTRFRTLVDEEMQMIEDYLESGRPVIGIRTSTHAFDFSKNPESPFAHYSYSNKSEKFTGGFGCQVLGQNWVNHWGGHGRQASRGRFAPDVANHPILRGIADGEIWGPTDVYEATLPQPDGCKAILLGEVSENMDQDAGPAPGPPAGAKGRQAIDRNDPMMPVAWTYRRPVGEKGRVFASTIGGAMAGKDDWANEGMRRMFVNACFWTLEMEDEIPAKADVTPVLQPNPFRRGVKPAEALEDGLATRAKKDNTILFYGNSMIERLLEHGELEARLQIAQPGSTLQIRSLAWTGDEVGNRLRLEGYAKHMKNLLAEWPANTIVLGYGLNESFAGEAGLTEFKQHYTAHLEQLSGLHPGARFVMLSPIAIEGASAARQAEVDLYRNAIAELATGVGAEFVDLNALTKAAYAKSDEALTNNGVHLNEKGNQVVAKALAEEIAIIRGLSATTLTEPDPAHLQEVAEAASAKHRRVAEVVRPKNAVVYFGVRARTNEYNEEMPRYHEMIRQTEAVVHQLARDSKLSFGDQPAPALPPLEERTGRDDGDRTGIIKSVAENQAEFEVADGYEVNLFASEEEFPELRNPVQIAFDARGRLWVVTMPSFPHTVPGLTPPDKILILEDTDRDGKADQVTTFAEGLDALDGVAFHRDGVIISEQPRLWLMQDADGDDVADTRRELLRGIDVTDSHHGGMIAADPYGDVIFSDGVFHRSQLETPFGVHRGIDATTYRLNPISGQIDTEWQHTTPNPWNVTFNKWGGILQMYGDGDVYDGSSLIWTPLGAYQPYAYGRITSYGKGSGCSVISSPNFPDEYQQGLVSASLLGRYAVNITKFQYNEGMVKQKSYESILSSPNAAFRPADVEFGMDGALYVSDFCSPIIGHAQHPMRSPYWDHDFGRIWRIVHTEKPVAEDWPEIEGASVDQLCDLLLHDHDLVRHHVRIELRKQGVTALAVLDRWLDQIDPSSADYLQAALEVIFVCEGLGETRPKLLQVLLDSDDFLYRGAGLQTLRLQADRLERIPEMLTPLVNDPHPRVQIEVIDVVAHLRAKYPEVEKVLETFQPINQQVSNSLAYLDYGTEPVKGRSVPVLDIDPRARLTHWNYLGEKGENTPVEVTVGQGRLPGEGLFRTFIEAEQSMSAIIGINHKNLEVRLNSSVVFEQNSFWSGDQQINVELNEGLNVIEVLLRKGRRSGAMPPVYVYDPVGQALSGARYSSDLDLLRNNVVAYDKMIEERGNLISVQAAAGLQFSPKQSTVTPGSKVRLSFRNPDIMMHNWVLIEPGSANEIGALADQLAASGKGVEREYLPESDKILVASKLLGPKGEQELVFQAPKEPGNYPYICTFPGHWRVMQGTLIVAERKAATPVAPAQTPGKAVTQKIGEGVVFETASSAEAFKTLALPTAPAGKISVNQKTNNDPIGTLTDGKLAKGYGPIFGNGIEDGLYKMNLGKLQNVSAVTSWSHSVGSRRGHQSISIYGSAQTTDPGWDISDASHFTPLGVISTKRQKLDAFTALSLRSPKGKSLGEFQWVVWSVAPVSELGGGENTAFQELAVETSKGEVAAGKASSMGLPEVRGQFVRIELPGKSRQLSLAEVQVFEKGVNLALKKKATQSTVGYSGVASRAVDGNTDGNYLNESVTHTEANQDNPWWEVDLGKMVNLEEIILYNRTNGHGDRLDGFTLKILDADRKVVFSKEKAPQSEVISFLQDGIKSSQAKEIASLAKPKQAKAVGGSAHLFILSGQSNMVGLDPAVSFIPAVNKAFDEDSVIVVKDAENSQSIRRWYKGWKSVQGKAVTGSGDLYDRLLDRVNEAVSGRDIKTVTLVWMQGEADAAGNQVGVYKASLDGLLDQLRQDFKREDIRFVIGRLSDYSLDSGKHPEWQKMRDLQVSYADASPLGAWVDTDDLNNKTDPKTDALRNDVHYTRDGYRIFGERLAKKAIELIPPAAFPGIWSDFRGFDRYDKVKTASGHFAVVCPKDPAPGKPWLWRSLFWEAIKKVSDADLKLVEEGYHVVLAHGDVAGHPKGNANIDAAYEMVTKEYGFAKTCSMSSMSRGTLSLFRWATVNPEKVNSIYVDNGVCNVLSWPAGKVVPGNESIANGAPGSWEDFKKKFGYATDTEALKTKESPIDLLKPLAKAGVPILMVCGNKDAAVPYEENDAVMEERYKELGGSIRVIVEDKGHSHGMNDPTPVLEFIRENTQANLEQSSSTVAGDEWIVDSQEEWHAASGDHSNLDIRDGLASPTAKEATFRSVLKTSGEKRSAKSIAIDQSPVWHNWDPIKRVGPSNLGDAPVMLTLGPRNYWMFGRYSSSKQKDFKSEAAKLEGYDVPLQTTPFPNQYNAPGGLKKGLGGYHAWQSRDLVNWVHHGPVTEAFSSWVTTAEYADGKAYIYYDYPNDQDPHLYIDEDLTDGIPGKNMGMAFKDPSHGSDCAFIRDLEGNFHVIYENWDPIDASKHSWDSPLAGHAVSPDGIGKFKILPPAVDERTKPTGKFAEYPHPHWHSTNPKKYPGKPAPADVPQHRIKKGEVRSFAQYEIHEPEQNAYGDWASISVGGQYYLFGDYHPANDSIRVGWFTSSSLDLPFTFCGEIGKGHPDPDIAFAEGEFYLSTQLRTDYVSAGPWVESVDVRVGVDTDNDGTVNQWTDWQTVKEHYDYIPGFSKQVAKAPAEMDLSSLPEGYGFQFELHLTDTTENAAKPILDRVSLSFQTP